ncbi:uncharacterized protein [Amphiura filiformis]|uniref:uncharacterized protein n=1 Tax=Amphiura filiformis TaxID=82378 RepID=UPI003B22722E
MADPTYIEGDELRKWVKQHLSRTLFQTAHELALQTKCELLIKIQDSQNIKDSHYYATTGFEDDFSNGGLHKEQWDINVSSNSVIPKTESDPLALKIVNAVSLSDDGIDHNASGGSAQVDNSGDDGEMPSARRHPFGIIPRKQQNNTAQQRVSNQEQLTNISQPVVQTPAQPSIQITQQNPNCAVVQVVPSSLPQQTSQVRTINAQGTPIQLTGGSTGSPTMVPAQQLNKLKQGQMFIMQKVGNTQVLTPVNVQQQQGATPVPTMVSPTALKADKDQVTPRKLAIRPANPNQESPPGAVASGGFSGRPFKCGVCYKTFGSVQVLTRHSQTFHELIPNKRFFCDLCGKNYKHPQHLQQHMATHNSTAPYKCSQCHRGFYRMGTLKDHELLHLGMYRYYCPECRKGFMRPSLLQEHINRFHTAMVTPAAPVENTGSVVPTNLMYAQQVVGQDAESQDNTSLQDNEDEAGGDADPSDGNADDAKEDSQTDNLNGITIKQERLSPTEMDKGDQMDEQSQPSTEDNQNNQASMSHIQTGGGGGTSVLGQLPTMVPMSSTSGQASPAGTVGKINPKFVAYTSIKPSGQVAASASSGGGRPPRRYSCDICGKTYKYVFHMREHRLTHSGNHPFVCKICNTGFFRQRQLREHQFRHSGSFPYSCDKCNKGFFRPSELRRHRSVKHGIVATGGDD